MSSPNEDLPQKAMENYKEAASVLSRSPRAAAALLRLALEILCDELGGQGKNLYKKIQNLAEKDAQLSEVAEAMHAVRFIGNEGAHTGTIQLNENSEIVGEMFELVNFVAEQLITAPKKRAEKINRVNALKTPKSE